MSFLKKSFSVIPAKAGIQFFQGLLDPGFRRGDGFIEFCKSLLWIKNKLRLEVIGWVALLKSEERK